MLRERSYRSALADPRRRIGAAFGGTTTLTTSLLTAAAFGQRWLLRAGAILLPLTYWPLTYDRYVLPKLILARALVLALAILLVVRSLASGSAVIKRTPLDIPLLAFLASALVSTMFAINANVGLFGTYSRYDGTLTLITYAALFWLAVQAVDDSKDAQGLLRALLVGAYIAAVLAIGQWLRNTLLGGDQQARAYGTLGNANVLGAYLVMLIPLAYHELRTATSIGWRLVAANVLLTMGLAVVLTASHSAWLGVAMAFGILIVGRQYPAVSRRRQVLFVVGALAIFAAAAPFAFGRITDLAQRSGIWVDSIHLIASRPLLGYGPDTFGLAYPGFQSAPWVLGYPQIDKAHSEVLQVASTQGFVGLAIWIWILAVFIFAFWRGRSHPMAWTLFAGWAAYQVVLLFNFSALGSGFPFWMFAAAAMVQWGAIREISWVPQRARRAAAGLGVMVAAALLALSVPMLVLPYLADSRLLQATEAEQAGNITEAATMAAAARNFNPQESVYAVEVGNLAFAASDWAAARAAYLDADWLGTFNPRVYRDLAIADRYLGLPSEALEAARHAVYLDPFDPANQALLAQMEIPGP
jgi:O-antigen ligase